MGDDIHVENTLGYIYNTWDWACFLREAVTKKEFQKFVIRTIPADAGYIMNELCGMMGQLKGGDEEERAFVKAVLDDLVKAHPNRCNGYKRFVDKFYG